MSTKFLTHGGVHLGGSKGTTLCGLLLLVGDSRALNVEEVTCPDCLVRAKPPASFTPSAAQDGPTVNARD